MMRVITVLIDFINEMKWCIWKICLMAYLTVSSRYDVLLMVDPPIWTRRSFPRSSLCRWWLLLPSEISSKAGGGVFDGKKCSGRSSVEQDEGAIPSDYMWYRFLMISYNNIEYTTLNIHQIAHLFFLNRFSIFINGFGPCGIWFWDSTDQEKLRKLRIIPQKFGWIQIFFGVQA